MGITARKHARTMRGPIRALWIRLFRDEAGAGLIEYSLLAGLISVATVGALSMVSDEQDDTYDCLGTTIEIGQESIHCDQIGKTVPKT